MEVMIRDMHLILHSGNLVPHSGRGKAVFKPPGIGKVWGHPGTPRVASSPFHQSESVSAIL